MSDVNLPRYDELPLLAGTDIRHAWDVFGRDDVLGSVNLLTDERAAAAAQLVRTGRRISLDLPLDVPDPPLFGRQAHDHVVFALNRNEMDDRLDGFHPQRSTQWDGLNHVRCREHGYWGGRQQDPTDGPNELGVHNLVAHGIAGRGVLVDLAGSLEAAGDYHALDPHPITVEQLQAVIDEQGVQLQPGDIVCLRTGWTEAYRRLDQSGRAAYAADPHHAGLRAYEDMARFLWETHPGALCVDNPAVEVVPGNPEDGSLHRRVLAAQGLTLGEMFDFDTLSTECRADGRWSFLFVASPLNLTHGLGSPGNAMAIL